MQATGIDFHADVIPGPWLSHTNNSRIILQALVHPPTLDCTTKNAVRQYPSHPTYLIAKCSCLLCLSTYVCKHAHIGHGSHRSTRSSTPLDPLAPACIRLDSTVVAARVVDTFAVDTRRTSLAQSSECKLFPPLEIYTIRKRVRTRQQHTAESGDLNNSR